LREGYTDNLNRQEENPVRTFLLSLGWGLEVLWTGRETDGTLSYRLSFNRVEDYRPSQASDETTRKDTVGHNVRLRLERRFGSRTSVGLEERFRMSRRIGETFGEEEPLFGETFTNRISSSENETNSFSGFLTYFLTGKIQGEGRLSFDSLDYDERVFASDRDSDTKTAKLSFSYTMTPRDAWNLGWSHRERDFSSDYEFESDSFDLSYARTLSERLSGTITGNLNLSDYHGGESLQDGESYVGGVGLTYQTPKSTISARASVAFSTFDFDEEETEYETWAVFVDFTRIISEKRRVILRANGSYFESSYDDNDVIIEGGAAGIEDQLDIPYYESGLFTEGDRDDRAWRFGVRLDGNLIERLSLTLGYNYARRLSNIPGESYVDNRFMISFTTRFNLMGR
jgi:hypothetical protein